MSYTFHKTIVVMVLTVASAVVAFAHAILVKSTPSANGTVTGPEVAVVLTFNSKVDQARSTLMLERADHSTSRVRIKADSSSPAMLKATILNLVSGPYKLRWQVLAVDGHITRGEIAFKVM